MLLSAATLAGCLDLFLPKPTPLKVALAEMPQHGAALLVDGCVQRRTPLFSRDYYSVAESHALAGSIEREARRALAQRGIAVSAYAEPFVCGYRGSAADREAHVADKFDAAPIAATLPVARFPTVAEGTPRGKALRALFGQAAGYDTDLFDERPPPLDEPQRHLLRSLLKSRHVLIVAGTGRYSSAGVAIQTFILDAAVGLLGAGGEGIYDDTDLHAALIDLDSGRAVWGNRPRADTGGDGNGIDPTREFDARAGEDVDRILKPLWSGDEHP